MNMSYCRFHNTVEDLQDCYDNLDDHDLSEEETRARLRLIKLCQQIVADAEWSGLIEEDEIATDA
jgi:hypothetical protein